MKNLIIKFISNTITSEELSTLQKWLENPKNKDYFKEMIKTNQRLDFAYREIDVETAYQRIINATSENKVESKKGYGQFLKYAAIAILLLSTSFGIYTYVSNSDKVKNVTTQQIVTTDTEIVLELEDGSLKVLDESKKAIITNNKGDKIVKQEYNKLKYSSKANTTNNLVYNKLIIPYGKRFVIELSDGTIVHLNAGTKLRYPTVFSDNGNRDVYLDGEAFFDVSENKKQPFVVHTEQMDVRVLGTKFNVSSYENEESTSTVLVEGSVSVLGTQDNNDDEGIIISPSQQALIEKGSLVVQDVDIQKYIAWMDGTLYFVNDRFEDIIKELERNYNVKIMNNHQVLNSVRYTGNFQNKTLSEVLNVFKRNTKFDFEFNGDTIVIAPTLHMKQND
ncbi:DUF4974 domain-containing protein [Aurantibacter crassamenti]|uniref:FecR family protein n=1 Tax=Aurantibacter crassamenti TaxID=1837375 RepID=UPI00193A8E73|nr:FecR family protein [Aurantibacter crassamenti]MBM1106823.1 DUF4974 domain-containing protein [Aurantibacter crassamenti]